MAVLKIHNLNIHRLFNEIGIHMKMLKDFSFWMKQLVCVVNRWRI